MNFTSRVQLISPEVSSEVGEDIQHSTLSISPPRCWRNKRRFSSSISVGILRLLRKIVKHWTILIVPDLWSALCCQHLLGHRSSCPGLSAVGSLAVNFIFITSPPPPRHRPAPAPGHTKCAEWRGVTATSDSAHKRFSSWLSQQITGPPF